MVNSMTVNDVDWIIEINLRFTLPSKLWRLFLQRLTVKDLAVKDTVNIHVNEIQVEFMFMN